jgi:hypothetical protein
LRELEAENARLRKMYADLALDVSVLKEALTKKLHSAPVDLNTRAARLGPAVPTSAIRLAIAHAE